MSAVSAPGSIAPVKGQRLAKRSMLSHNLVQEDHSLSEGQRTRRPYRSAVTALGKFEPS